MIWLDKKEFTCPRCNTVFKQEVNEPGELMPFVGTYRFKCPKCKHEFPQANKTVARFVVGLLIVLVFIIIFAS